MRIQAEVTGSGMIPSHEIEIAEYLGERDDAVRLANLDRYSNTGAIGDVTPGTAEQWRVDAEVDQILSGSSDDYLPKQTLNEWRIRNRKDVRSQIIDGKVIQLLGTPRILENEGEK